MPEQRRGDRAGWVRRGTPAGGLALMLAVVRLQARRDREADAEAH